MWIKAISCEYQIRFPGHYREESSAEEQATIKGSVQQPTGAVKIKLRVEKLWYHFIQPVPGTGLLNRWTDCAWNPYYKQSES